MLKAQDRVVMISGANRGIGKAIAKRLANDGYKLSLGVRDTSSVDKTSLPESTGVFAYDAADAASADAWVNSTLADCGRIDAIVMNAGVLHPVGFGEKDETNLDQMWDINFKGPLRLINAALPLLKQCGHGRVVNIVSLSGKRVLGGSNLGYCASKYSALSLTHAIRQEGWADGLRATAICPGLVDTDMVAHVDAPAGEFKITPEAIAASTAYALSLPNDATVAEILVNSRLETVW